VAQRDDSVELADVPAVCRELSRLGEEKDAELSKRNGILLLEARCASAEVVTSVA
jgi:hypothetical protein